MPEIELSGLTKRFGETVVIDDLNLTMAHNEFTVLVGPSGCGKSTVLRMIAGLETVTGGRILIAGQDVVDLEPKERDIAMVFQDYALYPHMSVARNMSFALRLARFPKAEIEQRVQTAAALLGLSPYLHRKPAELSGGQRQRVAMGRVLVRDAGIFLFDEPLSNLDAKLRTQMRAELAVLRQKVEKNMIYVTHDQIEAMTLGDRIVVLSKGVIQQEGSPEELYRTPRNRFVAGFIGSPAMNFFDGQLAREDGVPGIRVGDTLLRLPVEAGALEGPLPRPATLGIRPNRIGRASGTEGVNQIAADVRIAEYIGAQTVLHLDTPIGLLAVEWPIEAPIRVGERLAIELPAERIYVFDGATENRIVGGAAG